MKIEKDLEKLTHMLGRMAVLDHCSYEMIDVMEEAFNAAAPDGTEMWNGTVEFRAVTDGKEWGAALFLKGGEAPLVTLSIVCNDERSAGLLVGAMNGLRDFLDSFAPEETDANLPHHQPGRRRVVRHGRQPRRRRGARPELPG